MLLASFCAERSCTPVGSDVVNARTRCGTQNAMCTHVWDRLKARWCQGGNPESGAVCAVALVFIQSPTTRSLTGLSLINSRDKTQLVSHAWLHVDPPRFSPRRPPSVLITRKLRRTQRKLAVSITLPSVSWSRFRRPRAPGRCSVLCLYLSRTCSALDDVDVDGQLIPRGQAQLDGEDANLRRGSVSGMRADHTAPTRPAPRQPSRVVHGAPLGWVPPAARPSPRL